MRRAAALVLMLTFAAAASADAQGRSTRKPQRKPVAKPAAPAPLKRAPATVNCQETLGTGMKTGASYCFVLAGTEASQGVIVTIPPHTGTATLIFDLHNRHTYSEEHEQSGRGFARYSAGIAVLAMNMDVIGRAAVRSEFRKAADLYERISGGAGPGGAKAVAPLGHERAFIDIPPGIDRVSLLGEVLEAHTPAGRETATPGRPVAVVSNVQIEYRPATGKR